MKKEVKRKLPGGWSYKEFPKCLIKESVKTEKIPETHYLKEGKYPIVDQGSNFIAGYTNDESLVYMHQCPVIVFGDHTRTFKYVDFNFAIGADGTKIIHPNTPSINPRYFYFALKASSFPNDGYNRHYKYLQKLEIPFPPTEREQIKVSQELQRKMNELEKMKQATLRQKDAISAMQGAILREIFPYKEGDKLPAGWKWEKIENHILDCQSGLACGDKSRNEGYAHLRMNNISRDFKLDLTSLWRIPASNKEVDTYRVKEGDILFNNTNSAELVGKSCLFDSESKDVFLFSNHLTRIRTKETLYSLYLLYWTNILWNRRYFENNCDIWVNQAAIRAKDSLFPLNIPMPPRIDEQIRIVAKLKQKVNELERMSDVVDKKLEAIESLQGAILRETFDFQEVNN